MADSSRTPATRVRRRVGPLLEAGGVVTLAVLVLGGCVGAGFSGGTAAPTASLSRPGTASPPPPSSVAGTVPSAPAAFPTPTAVLLASDAAPIVVTIANDGTTLHLAVGQQFTLSLGNGEDWMVKVADEQVVQHVTGTPLPAGAQGIYEARKPGATVLSAVGSPHCTSGVCPLFRLAFSVSITVS
jgi:hypothetical protein